MCQEWVPDWKQSGSPHLQLGCHCQLLSRARSKSPVLRGWAPKGNPALVSVIPSLSSLKSQGTEPPECHFCPFLSLCGAYVGHLAARDIKDSKNVGFPSMLRKQQYAKLSNVFRKPWRQNNVELLLLSWKQWLPLWLKFELYCAVRKEKKV